MEPAAGIFPHSRIHFVGGPKSELEKRRILIEQFRDALARKEAPEFVLAILAGLAAAFAQNVFFLPRSRRNVRGVDLQQEQSSGP